MMTAEEQGAIIEAAEAAGEAWWVEAGVIKHGPKVDVRRFGAHGYGKMGMGICKYGCGCEIGQSWSFGPVDPFGMCPKNPRPQTSPTVQQESDGAQG